ncbi:MAG: hypothetical protein WCY27_03080 [archaeon]|nr:hypothetical protein [archaeon]MDD2477766.1 hypothetical protein [Candidatus ainarchaeum sp.]MDD3084862.1 hypothetical protein [Candidatus ainarchaeum sp.]MDD4221196.1 hypothetical protein [Candidatus ainarchaeum sp.]MDD4662852.1 hypothetical protein [Candidatus ainarchaeum sp.]
MDLKKITITIFILLIFININHSVFAVKILEPVYEDLRYTNVVDLGFASPGESFLISFLIEKGEDYTDIKINQEQKQKVIIENVKNTKESIFTTIKLDEELKEGELLLKIILVGKEQQKEIILKLDVSDKVIYTTLDEYLETGNYDEPKTIKFNVINKSITTKTIIVSSDLSDYWFNKDIKKHKKMYLTPNSITNITYTFTPKEIGTTNFKVYIIPIINEKTMFINTDDYIIYNLKTDIKKSISGIYGTKEHYFPLFNNNLIPIYFFNKIIKLI